MEKIDNSKFSLIFSQKLSKIKYINILNTSIKDNNNKVIIIHNLSELIEKTELYYLKFSLQDDICNKLTIPKKVINCFPLPDSVNYIPNISSNTHNENKDYTDFEFLYYTKEKIYLHIREKKIKVLDLSNKEKDNNNNKIDIHIEIRKVYFDELNNNILVLFSNNFIMKINIVKNPIRNDDLLPLINKLNNPKIKNTNFDIYYYNYYSNYFYNPEIKNPSLSCIFIKDNKSIKLLAKFEYIDIIDIKFNSSYIGILTKKKNTIFLLEKDNLILHSEIETNFGEVKYYSFQKDFLFISCEDDNIYLIDYIKNEISFILSGHKNYVTNIDCISTSQINRINENNFLLENNEIFKEKTIDEIINTRFNKRHKSINLDNNNNNSIISKKNLNYSYRYVVISSGYDGLFLQWEFEYDDDLSKCQSELSSETTVEEEMDKKLILKYDSKNSKIIYNYTILNIKNNLPILNFWINKDKNKLYFITTNNIKNDIINITAYNINH